MYTPQTGRIVRASVLVLREMDYVQAAQASGAGHGRVLARHILPNSLALNLLGDGLRDAFDPRMRVQQG